MKHLTLAATLLAAAPALAQDRMTPADCTESWANLASLMDQTTGATVTVDDEGWCQIPGHTFGLNGGTQVQARVLRWRATDIGRFIEDDLPPRSLDIEAIGLATVIETGDEVFDYLMGLQTADQQIDIAFSAKWDGVQNAVTVDRAQIVFNQTNRVELTARFENVDLNNLISLQASLGSAGLRELTLKSDFDGWFEAYVALPLGTSVLQSGEVAPEAQVVELRAQAVDFVESLPDAVVPPPSKAALSDFIAALPQPRGTLQLQLSANPLIGAARAVPLALMDGRDGLSDAIDASTEGVTILVTWSGRATP